MVDDDDAAPAEVAFRTVDAAAIVAEIEAAVARRHAAGDYPEELIARLRSDLRVVPDDEPPEALALIDSSRPLRSERPGVGGAVVFAKRAMRRLLAWYVNPIAEDQTRFNLSLLRDVRSIERRLARVETPLFGLSWSPTAPVPTSPVVDALVDSEALAIARTLAYGALLAATGEGRTLVMGGGPALASHLGTSGVQVVAAEALSAATRAASLDPLRALEGAPPESVDCVVIAGILPRLSAAETLRIIPAASSALRAGGVLVVDSPLPARAGAQSHPAGVHPAMLRWIPPETVTLLMESAGLAAPDVSTIGRVNGIEWYAVVSTRPTD